MTQKVVWDREDVQRALYHIVRSYEQAYDSTYTESCNTKKMPRRFIFFGQRLPFLGGDSELLRNAIDIGRETLKDNNWWPKDI